MDSLTSIFNIKEKEKEKNISRNRKFHLIDQQPTPVDTELEKRTFSYK